VNKLQKSFHKMLKKNNNHKIKGKQAVFFPTIKLKNCMGDIGLIIPNIQENIQYHLQDISKKIFSRTLDLLIRLVFDNYLYTETIKTTTKFKNIFS